MRRTRTVATLTALVSLAASYMILGAGPASAAGTVKIVAAYFDPIPNGPDPNTAAGRNQEYIVIRNSGSQGVALAGWVLHDVPRLGLTHRYVFPSFTLRPGRSVRVHTGPGTNSGTDLYWGEPDYVWGDDSDTATLQNRSGAVMSSCAWTVADTSPHFC
jgi:hypothetical protein